MSTMLTSPPPIGGYSVEEAKQARRLSRRRGLFAPDLLQTALKQSFIMINEPSTNEDYFGKVKYVMIHHETYDVFLFRFVSDHSKLLAVIAKPREYDHIKFVEAITYELLTV